MHAGSPAQARRETLPHGANHTTLILAASAGSQNTHVDKPKGYRSPRTGSWEHWTQHQQFCAETNQHWSSDEPSNISTLLNLRFSTLLSLFLSRSLSHSEPLQTLTCQCSQSQASVLLTISTHSFTFSQLCYVRAAPPKAWAYTAAQHHRDVSCAGSIITDSKNMLSLS